MRKFAISLSLSLTLYIVHMHTKGRRTSTKASMFIPTGTAAKGLATKNSV